MIASNDVLCIVDCDYLYGKTRELYGDTARLAYPKLVDFVKAHRPPGLTYHLTAFIAIRQDSGNYGQLKLVSLLARWGFEVQTGKRGYDPVARTPTYRDNMTEKMINYVKDFRCHQTDFPQTLIVVSGNSFFADLYDALLHQGVAVEVFAFGEPHIFLQEVGMTRYEMLDETVLYLS